MILMESINYRNDSKYKHVRRIRLILHLFNYDEKFIIPYVNFINENFDKNQHMFLIVGKEKIEVIGDKIKQFESYRKNLYKSITLLNSFDKIVIHGLNNTDLSKILFFQPWLLKKSYWVIWGGDLYYYRDRRKNIKSGIHEFFRRFIIRNIGGLITHIRGDYELAKEWYGVKGSYYYSFMYPSNLYHGYSLPEFDKGDKIYIQVGNSADPSNNHVEIFHKLRMYKDLNVEIICPLSYGNNEYRDSVIHEGKKMFGNKFNPLIEFLSFDDYLTILSKIDIAIFNHKRQQAMGNIITLLGLGKKVYIREEITTWPFCMEHDLKVHSANGDFDNLFNKMDEQVKNKNIENVKMKFSEEKLVKDWRRIFNA